MAGKPRATNSGESTGHMIRDSALGLVPETLDSYLTLNRLVWEAGPLPPQEIEVARLRNARRVNCVFCRSVRYDIARAGGLTEDRVEQIRDDYLDSELSEREKLILACTDQFLDAPGDISEDLISRLQGAFTPAELAHLFLAISHFCGFSRCAVSLGGMPDELPVIEVSLPE